MNHSLFVLNMQSSLNATQEASPNALLVRSVLYFRNAVRQRTCTLGLCVFTARRRYVVTRSALLMIADEVGFPTKSQSWLWSFDVFVVSLDKRSNKHSRSRWRHRDGHLTSFWWIILDMFSCWFNLSLSIASKLIVNDIKIVQKHTCTYLICMILLMEKMAIWINVYDKNKIRWYMWWQIWHNDSRFPVTGEKVIATLQWRHNERDGVSHHWRIYRLLKILFMHRSKKTPKLRVTGLCEGIHRWPVDSPHKGIVMRKMFPYDDS